MGTQTIPIGEVIVELGNMVAQHPDFLFQHFLSVLGGVTSLLRPAKLINPGGHVVIEFTNPVVALDQRLFELLERPPMSRFSITQLDLQLMDSVLHRLKLLDPGTEVIPIGKAFIELGDVLA